MDNHKKSNARMPLLKPVEELKQINQINVKSQNDMKDIIENIIRKRALDLLEIISLRYPTKFPKNLVSKELEFILNQINIDEIYNIPGIINISTIDGDSNWKDKTITPEKQNNGEKKKMRKKLVDMSERCNARIWDNIFELSTKKEIANVDDKFNVNDFNDIDIKQFQGKYIVGVQCRRKKNINSKYCFQHNKHSPHGDYFLTPTPELCLHFMKDGNYI